MEKPRHISPLMIIHTYICDSLILLTVAAAMIFSLSACHNDDLWDEMPQEISEFVSTYFPGQDINEYSSNGETYHVRVSDGPGLTFDKDYKWVAIAGYGMPLPRVLLFDQLPPVLYKYLESTQQLDSVFSLDRDSADYTVTLQYSTLIYDTATGEISGSRPDA